MIGALVVMGSWNLGIFADLSIEAIWISVALCVRQGMIQRVRRVKDFHKIIWSG